jgi:hypothetical protein
MSTRLVHIVVDATNAADLARFWTEALRWRIVIEDIREVEIAGREGDVPIIFVPVPEPKRSKNRIHFDLVSESESDQRETVERLIGIGARRIDIGQGDVRHVVLADPEGNEFCVVPPDYSSAETGLRGAIAYDAATPALGRFWSEAIDWPVAYERGEYTGIRAPDGVGPFITFGPPVAPKSAKNRLHLDIAPTKDGDQRAEVERLLTLGATRVDIGQGDVSWVVLADPEGNEFCVLTPR